MSKVEGVNPSMRHMIKTLVGNMMAPLFRLNIHLLKSTKYCAIYMKKIMEIYEENVPEYISLMRRPKKEEKIISIEKPNDILNQTAIIMQGPIVHKDDFTLESIKIYNKIFPGVLVIVSTWEDEKKENILEIEQLGNCIVILNKYPKYSGLVNLNYQVASTLSGIHAARDLGKKYVLKTRTDYRFMRLGCLEFMHGLLKDYPVDDKVGYQKERIILASSIQGSMFKAYWPGDQYAYGNIEDMLHYWDYDMQEINLSGAELMRYYKENQFTQREAEESLKSPEVALQMDYYKRMQDEATEFTLESYWNHLKSQYIILSREDLAVYWPKYLTRYDEAERMGTYYADDSEEKCLSYNWDYIRWYNLYNGTLTYKKEYEAFREKYL